MKIAVVYYSLEGNTQYAAEKISSELHADIIRLIPAKEYPTGKVSKYFWAGMSATFRETPKLEANAYHAETYDLVLLGSPIWAGTFAPPLRTFIRANDWAGKKTALFACCSGGGTEKCFAQMQKEMAGCDLLSTLSLIDPLRAGKAEADKNIASFCAKLKADLD